MKKKIVFSMLFIIIAAAAVLLFLQLISGKEVSPVVIIGLDGADWDIIDPLFQENKLPNLKKLVSGGAAGPLKTILPTSSPVIWTSIATGKGWRKHGIYDSTYVKKNNIQVPFTSIERRAKTFWNILTDLGFTVGVINWWYSFPVEEVNGYIVSERIQIGVLKDIPTKDIIYPQNIADAVFSKLVRFKDRKYRQIIHSEGIEDYLEKSQKMNLTLNQEEEADLKRFWIYTLQDKSIENISSFLFENVESDLFATYFRLIDTTSHFSAMFLDPELQKKWKQDNEMYGGPTEETQKLLTLNMIPIIEPVYVYLDNVVGRIVSKAKENTTLILISDHGFQFSKIGYNHTQAPDGIIIMHGPKIKKGHEIKRAHVFDITPTLLYLFGQPVGEDMDGKVLLEAFTKSRKVKLISTYEGEASPKKTQRSKTLDEDVLEDLRSLGYIK